MKNLVFNLRTAKAQAEGCAKVTKSSRMAKVLTTLTLLLTLCVGQMWGYTLYLYTGSFTDWENDGVGFRVWTGYEDVNFTSLGNHWWSCTTTRTGTMYIKRYSGSTDHNQFTASSVSSTNNVFYVSGWNNSGGALKYYIKHPWDGGSWTWQTMTINSANTFKYTGIYKSSNGANVNQDKGNSNYLTPSNASNVNDKVPAIWTYTPSSNSLRIDPAYTLTVNADSHGSASGSQPKGIKMSTKYAISASNNTGYHFSSWSRVSGGTCTFDNSSSASTNVTVTGDASATVQANFALNTYTVAYNANDDQYPGTASGSTTSSSHTYGTAKNLTSNGFSRTGYIFAGWATSPTGDVAYTNGQSVTNLSSTQGATVTLYAKWTAITLSASISPSTINANTATTIQFNITTNAPLSSRYYFEISNWGGKNSGTAGGYNIDGDHEITSASPFTYNLAAAMTNLDAGTYKIKLKITKDAVTQVESDLITLVVSSSTYSVTVSAGAGGTVSPTSISASPDSWSGDITATPDAGYRFVNWTSSGGGITIKNNTSATTQVKATSTGGTLTANFAAATYRVTLDNQSATTAGTEYVDATYNTTTLTTITKPTKTNYTFGGYYTATDGGGTQIIDANGNWLASKSGFTDGSRRSIITENKNLYAKWTETTYAVTVAVDDASHTTGNIACSATGWVAGTSGTAQIGNLTNVNITAGAAAPGYKFDGGYWTLTGGVTLISGSLTSPAITVKATAAGSAIFTYAEDLSTSYVINGGSAFGGSDPWWNQNIPFTKKSGESTGTIAYAEIPISAAVGDNANTNYNFKVVKKGVSDVWYGLSGDGDWWYSSSSGEQTMVVDNQNIQLRANVVGTYIVKLDYTTAASPKITITWPVALSIYRSNPTDGTNIGDHAWNSMPSSTSYRWLLDLAANTTYEFKINDKGAYYGNNTDITTSVSNRSFSTGTNDTKLITKSAGRFIFTWDGSGHRLTVVYPKSAAISASPASVYTGGTTTLTGYASELGSGSHTITYEFYKGTELTPANLIASKSKTESATYQQETQDVTVNFDGNTTSQVYTIQIKEGGVVLATNTVTVYRKWDIYVHDVASWGGMFIHMWGNGETTWPGNACSLYNGSTSWYTVTIDAKYPRFQLNCNECTNHKRTFGGEGAYTSNHATFPTGSYWYTKFDNTGGDGNDYYTLQSITLTDPTVTLSASIASCKNITLTGTVTDCGGDGSFASDMKEVYFQVAGTKNAATTVSTTSGTFTKVLSNATAGTTNTLQAFATNIHGTGSSSVLHYTNVTLDRQGGTTGTTAVTAVENMAMPAGATAPGKTGYTFGGYYASTGGSGKKYYNASMGSANNWDQTTKDKTIYAKWTAITYKVHFNGNGNTSGSMSDQTGIVYDSGTTLTANAFVKTGYNFAGWATTQERATAGTIDRLDGAAHGNLASTQGATAQLWAVWTPKTCTVTFDYQSSVEGYAGAGTLSNVTATYNAAMPALTGNMPTAAQGYAFMGFYSETGGNGTLYYNPDKTSAHNWDVDTESTTTLYAYYKKAEITGITFSPAAAEPDEEVTATATISPTPTGTTTVCWEVRYASNNVLLDPQPTFDPENGASVTFAAPPAAVYKFTATLKTGSDCAAGTVLDTEDANLTVAGNHAVTIRYKHGDVVIKEQTIENIHAVNPTEISAPNIIGYAFSSWTLGDGITLASGALTDATISVTAIYDGVITANYNTKRMIYFYNCLGWSSVNVYFYKNDSYWNNTNGTGADQSYTFSNTPYSEGKHGPMTRIDGTDIWYFDCEAAGVNASYDDVVFTELNQHGYGYFAKTDTKQNKVVRRGDYKSSMPMFVPVEQDGVSMNGGLAIYYNQGYWMNYPENTGYTVRIYNAWNDDMTSPAREYYFPYSSDKKMPLKLDVEFNTTDAKWFSIYRNDGVYLGVNAEMTQASHTNYRIKSSNDKIKIQPSAPGIYTYTLTFYDDEEKDGSGKAYGNMYHITVDYPVSVGDYRILYKDNATWSQGTAHTASWCHPSDAVNKISAGATEAKKDTVSLFISYGASPTAKFQYVSAINPSTGAVTWSDVTGGTISLSSITKSGTYNFIISQPVGGASVSVEKIEAYTGNYYIRTDCAGNTKWDNYRTIDHQMTYSEFSCSEANSFGEKFSHYFTHWCPAGTNVKFVIANDYSSCISDTLIQDVGNIYNNINSDGFLNSDGNPEETANRFSTNIRFMYNEATNKISRAYVASSTNNARWFLVLRSNSEIQNESGAAIEDIGTGIPSVIMADKQNWIYEKTLKILPGSKFKLFACYAEVTPSQSGAQYFRGYWAEDDWANSANTIELVGGSGSYQKVRVLYDFKTNRLVCAWLPDGDVTGEMNINADVMIIREHQEDATMITFTNSSSKLEGVKTVYGAMKFNRWILNNKSTETGHAVLPVANQKSIFERALYFISFPFDVNLGEVFGFGTYGVHWIIENYDGENRAKNGYWIDSPPNWKYVTSPKGYTLKANKGYILCLDLDLMKDDNEEFWPHGIETVELFFPSAVMQSTIEQAEVTIPAPDPAIYQCTINRGTPEGDRRIKDSYWRCLGVPSFANYTTTLSNGTSTITWQTGSTLPYLYAWNMENNTLTAQGTSTFAFKTMHAYLTQCSTAIVWTAASKPTPVIARYSENDMLKDREFRLELVENGVKADQTYIRLSAKEDVTSGFEFGNDLSKELNSGVSNIYTFIGYERAAANSLPLSAEQITIVPVGVVANAAGEYTFSMPDGTDGIGVTLIDEETGIRTSLSALDYAVELAAGDYTERFWLEISPVKGTETGIEPGVNEHDAKIRKVMIDGILYIIRDGKMYDARGARVE